MYDFITTCAGGLEKLVVTEIEQLGGRQIRQGNGSVAWSGNLESGYRCCLWSRFASRVLLQIAKFTIADDQSLYENTLKQQWADHLQLQTTFAVNCTLSKDSVINHSRFGGLRVKDAIADNFRNRVGERPSVQGERPGLQVHVHVEGAESFLYIDLSGEPLHKRGYRASGTMAPLKESLGAAIVALSGWQELESGLVDPMCGSGTLLIEAALMFGNSAPGLSRNYFGFSGWLGHERTLWESLVQEAIELEDEGAKRDWPIFQGYDCDPLAVSAARKNIQKTGLEEFIQIKRADVARLNPPAAKGMVLSNLPYGERLLESEIAARLYKGFGNILKERFSGWKAGVFISNPALTDSFGLSWSEKYKLYNGPIACRLLTGEVTGDVEKRFLWNIHEEQNQEGTEFGNRLKKNCKKLLKWADTKNITCFRVYDRDLPDHNFSIDIYSKWVVLQEYAPPKNIDPELAEERLRRGIRTVKEVLGLRSDRLFIKKRQRQKGKSQYQKKGSTKKMYVVREGQANFLVNFTDYLDTGLFLDHRPTRQKLFEQAKGKRFLNLYSYTGAATIHAALGGAASTVSVDLSANYVHWTRMNLALNGLSEVDNIVEKEDCIRWLENCTSRFDLIFIDPPTFSNTKKEKRVFDIQRDHIRLINLAMSCLTANGLLLFSTNFRRFVLGDGLAKTYAIKETTKSSIPVDFSRNQKIHRCWEIRSK